MKLANIACVSAAVLAVVASVGCNKADDDTSDDSLGTSESQLVADDAEASELDDDLEGDLDEPLSGAAAEEPGVPADGANDEELLEKARTNPGRFFKPAGCIVSTRAGNVITHVFTKCRGPFNQAEFNGTILSTFVREPGKITVTHAADGFTANGAAITGKRVVEWTREGARVTKKRTGSWAATTAKGKAITHEASFVSTYDGASKCITRDGSAQTTIDGRSFERSIDGYKRCGIGRGGCPESGVISLSRTKGGESVSVSIEFLGGVRYRVTRPNGTQVTRLLLCRPNAT